MSLLSYEISEEQSYESKGKMINAYQDHSFCWILTLCYSSIVAEGTQYDGPRRSEQLELQMKLHAKDTSESGQGLAECPRLRL